MFSIWKILGRSDLQRYIGDENLERLEEILPIFSNEELSKDRLYSIDGLSMIFDAFFGSEYMQNKKSREELFNRLEIVKIDEVLRFIGTPPETIFSFAEKVKVLSNEWDKEGGAQKISECLEISSDILPDRKKSIEPFEDIAVADNAYKPLKDYQFSVFSKAFERLSAPRRRFIIQMPTGSGKTRTTMEIISHYLNSESKSDDIVLWLAHSEELCDQAFGAFVETWSHLSTKPLRAVRFWGGIKVFPYDFDNNGFVVSSFQKLYSKLKNDNNLIEFLKSRVSLIIVDEAHKVLAPTYEKVTRAFMSDRTKLVGLTATPGRSAINDEENKKLAEFFFNEIVQIEAPERKTVIEYLRDKRVLSHVHYESVITHRSYTLTVKEKNSLEKFFDLPQEFIARLGQDNIRNVEIIKRLQSEAKSGKRILFFACGIEHSKFISALLRCLNIRAVHLDGSTSKVQRASTIEKFKKGEIKVLCNYGVLSTGFDAPQTDVVFISRPTSSIVLYSQMIGRGLRGPEIGGTETCKVIDVIDNITGFSNENKVYDYFKDYYES